MKLKKIQYKPDSGIHAGHLHNYQSRHRGDRWSHQWFGKSEKRNSEEISSVEESTERTASRILIGEEVWSTPFVCCPPLLGKSLYLSDRQIGL